MKTLFRSTCTTLQMIATARIDRYDLASGLFILDRSREVIMDFANWREEIASLCGTLDLGEAEAGVAGLLVNAHEQLVDAVLKAEADGRIIWSKTGLEITYDQVDDLLELNGEQIIELSHNFKHFYIDPLTLDESVSNVVIWSASACVDLL